MHETTPPPLSARIQRRRTAGWRMPPGAVYVGRGTRWGNPNRIIQSRASGLWLVTHPLGSPTGDFATATAARAFAARTYRTHLASHPDLVADARRDLAGRDLACWCPLPAPGRPDHCHAAVLLEIAVYTDADLKGDTTP